MIRQHVEIDEALPSARGLQRRLGFKTLIADLSSRFTHLNAGAVDREIEAALRRVCDPLGVDLAVLGQCSSADPGIALVTHVFAREALQPPGPLRQEQFPWYAREMRAGRSVAVSSLDALPAAPAVHPNIADAAVIPVPDTDSGEVPKAIVVVREPMSADAVMAFVEEHVAHYKRLRYVAFADSIPKSPSGKILRRVLVQREKEQPRIS